MRRVGGLILAVGIALAAGLFIVGKLPGGAGSAPVATPGATFGTTPRPTPTSVSYSDGISLVVPGSWHVSDADIALHYEHVIAYLGTGEGTMKCGADYIPGEGGTCQESITLPANGIELRLSAWYGPPQPWHTVGRVVAQDPRASAQTINGAAAVERELPAGAYGSDEVVEWTIDRPNKDIDSFVLTAYLKGPDLSAAASDLSRLIDSITIAPQAAPGS